MVIAVGGARALLSQPNWVLPGALIDMDFANGRYFGKRPGDFICTRASTQWEVDNNGNLLTFPANAPAIVPGKGLMMWEARTNSIANNTMSGAVAGSPGTLPTGWSELILGTTRQVVGVGTLANGMSYIDIRYSGTPNATSFINIIISSSTVAGVYGQTWAGSAYVALVGGSLTNIVSTIEAEVRSVTSGGAYISNKSTAVTLTSTLTAYSVSYTPTSSTTAFINFLVDLQVTSGQAIDITLRIALPQLELNPNIPATVASAVKAANGTGGVNGTAVYQVVGGTGTAATLNCTWAAGVLTVNSVANAGSYTASSGLPASPASLTYVSGTATGWTGATVTLTPTDNSAKGWATSPILTSSGTVTRAATKLSTKYVPPANPSLYGVGTPASPAATATDQTLLALSDTATVFSQYLLLRRTAIAGAAQTWANDGTHFQSVAGANWPINTSAKLAGTLDGSTIKVAFNGAAASSGGYVYRPTLGAIVVTSGASGWNGVIARAAVSAQSLLTA